MNFIRCELIELMKNVPWLFQVFNDIWNVWQVAARRSLMKQSIWFRHIWLDYKTDYHLNLTVVKSDTFKLKHFWQKGIHFFADTIVSSVFKPQTVFHFWRLRATVDRLRFWFTRRFAIVGLTERFKQYELYDYFCRNSHRGVFVRRDGKVVAVLHADKTTRICRIVNGWCNELTSIWKCDFGITFSQRALSKLQHSVWKCILL